MARIHTTVLAGGLALVSLVATTPAFAAQWSALVELTSANNVAIVATAMNDDGDAVAAFRRWSPSNNNINHFYVSIRRHGHGWSTPKQLSGPGQDATVGDVGIDGGGTVTATWQWLTYYAGGTSPKAVGAKLATKRPGHAWSDPIKATGVSHYSNSLALDVASSGRAVLSWISNDHSGNRVVVRTRGRDGAWHAPRAVSPVPQNGKQAFYQMSGIDNDGRVTAAWLYGAGGQKNALQRVSVSRAGHVGTRITVDSGISVAEPSEDLDVSDPGGAVLGWSRYRNGQWQAVAAFRRPGHAWRKRVLLNNDYYVHGLQAATSGDRAVVAWEAQVTNDGLTQQAQDATFAPARGWSRDAPLATGRIEQPLDAAITRRGLAFIACSELKTDDSSFGGHLSSAGDAGVHRVHGFGGFTLAALGMAPHGNLAVLVDELNASDERTGIAVRTRT